MSFFSKKMTKEAPAAAGDDEKPLPEPRPGTSGTENVLMTQTRIASQNYQKAHRAETTYRAKKRAGAGRRDFKSAREHFGAAATHFKQGLLLTFNAGKSVPYIVDEKRERARLKASEKKMHRALDKKKKLEETLTKKEGEDESTNDKEPEASSS